MFCDLKVVKSNGIVHCSVQNGGVFYEHCSEVAHAKKKKEDEYQHWPFGDFLVWYFHDTFTWHYQTCWS